MVSDVTTQPNQPDPLKGKPNLIWPFLQRMWDRIPSTWTAWGLSWLAMWPAAILWNIIIFEVVKWLPADALLKWAIWVVSCFVIECLFYVVLLLILVKHMVVSRGVTRLLAGLVMVLTVTFAQWHLEMFRALWSGVNSIWHGL